MKTSRILTIRHIDATPLGLLGGIVALIWLWPAAMYSQWIPIRIPFIGLIINLALLFLVGSAIGIVAITFIFLPINWYMDRVVGISIEYEVEDVLQERSSGLPELTPEKLQMAEKERERMIDHEKRKQREAETFNGRF